MRNMIAEPNEYMQGLKKDSLHANRVRYGNGGDLDSHRAMASSDEVKNRTKSSGQGVGPFHSDNEKSEYQGSNNSSTLEKYSRQARRTSSCH